MYRSLLSNVGGRCKAVQYVSTWEDVEKLLQRGSRDDPMNDQILLTILGALHQDKRPEWRSVLLFLFWRDLERIWRFLARLDAEKFDRWTNVLWAFSEAICSYDPSQRRERVTQKIRNDTINNVKKAYASRLFRVGLFQSLESDREDEEASPVDPIASPDPAWIEVEERLERKSIQQRLNLLVQRGVIAERDLPLLVGTIIYGRTITEWAREHGVSDEVAKKRRQRALKRIRNEIKELETF